MINAIFQLARWHNCSYVRDKAALSHQNRSVVSQHLIFFAAGTIVSSTTRPYMSQVSYHLVICMLKTDKRQQTHRKL